MPNENRIERLEALHGALRAARPRPQSEPAWFTASALLAAKGGPDALAAATARRHDALRSAIGKHRAPTGGLRWVYAAILTRTGIEADRLAALRTALRDQRKSSKTGALHAAGARAALLLSAGDLEPGAAAKRFFAMKQTLNPPWWRRDVAVSDTYAGAHVLRGDDPRAVAQARARALEVFATDAKTRAHKRTGARVTVLHARDARTVLKHFLALDLVRKRERILRQRVGRSLLMEWAAEGLNEADLDAIAQILDELPRRCGVSGEARARLAYLVHTSERENPASDAVTALAALMAAQTAAVIAASTAATIAANSTVS